MKKFNVKAVIGASFGDEGKGLMVDKLCRDTEGLVLNIRHNGGFQASHTVVNSNGDRHVFHGMGAGMFNSNVDTYLADTFMIDPRIMLEEIQSLGDYMRGLKVYVNTRCAITTFMEIELNSLREKQRGNSRHGSCGCGIYETFRRMQFPEYELRISDIYLGKEHLKSVIQKIMHEYFHNECVKLKASELDPGKYSDEHISEMDDLVDYEVDLLLNLKRYMIPIKDESILLDVYNNFVFEGGQGLMLDKDNTAYAPHLTPSSTGLDNIVSFLIRNNLKDKNTNIEVYYISRSYNTRHGAGFMQDEVSKEELGEKVEEATNDTNDFQGNFRFGYLNLSDIRNYTRRDFSKLRKWSEAKSCIVFTHMDQTNGLLVTKEENVLLEDVDWIWKQYYKVLISEGERAENIRRY